MATNESYNLPVGWIIQPNPQTKKTGYEYPNGVRVFQYGDLSVEDLAMHALLHTQMPPMKTQTSELDKVYQLPDGRRFYKQAQAESAVREIYGNVGMIWGSHWEYNAGGKLECCILSNIIPEWARGKPYVIVSGQFEVVPYDPPQVDETEHND